MERMGASGWQRFSDPPLIEKKRGDSEAERKRDRDFGEKGASGEAQARLAETTGRGSVTSFSSSAQGILAFASPTRRSCETHEPLTHGTLFPMLRRRAKTVLIHRGEQKNVEGLEGKGEA